MIAVGFNASLPITDPNSLVLFECEKPEVKGRDLLIRIEAISVNPVDYKVRQNSLKNPQNDMKVIGWDAAGIVEEVGEAVSLFSKGDRVFYAGDINKAGSNQEFQLVDERIVGFAPKAIKAPDAAAMPLTSLTVYELFFDRMRLNVEKDKGKSILIIGGAGGVGSVAIQIAKNILGLTVIATASRTNSVNWCKNQGADFVVDHHSLLEEMQAIGYGEVDFIVDFVDLNQYWNAIVELIKPQGQVGSISDPSQMVNLRQLKGKSVSFHWELMFTRAMFQTEDMHRQHKILNTIAGWIDEGTIRSTKKETLYGLTADNLKKAHQLLESGTSIGKIVIDY